MKDMEAYKELKEKSLEVILAFKPQDKFDKQAVANILKLKADIRKTIFSLPEKEKEILELRYFENLNIDQLSEKIKKNKKDTYDLLQKSLDLLNKTIKVNLINTEKPKESPKPEPKPQIKTQPQPVNPGEKPIPQGAVVVAGFISLVIIVGFFLIVWFLLQKIVIDNLPFIYRQVGAIYSGVSERIPTSKKTNTNKKHINKNELNLIKISGSSSLLSISEDLKANFIKKSKDYKIEIIPSDSNSGINSLIDGEIDIANSSRPLTHQDRDRAGRNGIELNEIRIAVDALVFFVNSSNPVNELSISDIQQIFSNQVSSWSAFGGVEQTIVPLIREEGSGTNDFVISRVLEGQDFSESIMRKNNPQEIIDFVSENAGGIGFVNSNRFPHDNQNLKYLKIKNYEGTSSYSPFKGTLLNEKALRYGDYPLSHYLYLIVSSTAKDSVNDYVEWILGKDGQGIIRKDGLIPIQEALE